MPVTQDSSSDGAEGQKTPELRAPLLEDARAMTRLVRSCPGLDANSHYAYLLVCYHFAETSVIAEGDDESLGFVSAFRPPKQSDTLFVWQVAVSEKARGRGLAGQMLDELLERDACDAVRWVEATVTASNTASQALFRSLARRHETGCQTTPLFPAEVFEGVEDHEPEDLFRIGPFEKQATS